MNPKSGSFDFFYGIFCPVKNPSSLVLLISSCGDQIEKRSSSALHLTAPEMIATRAQKWYIPTNGLAA
jgi:hypothetical protein